MKAIEIDIYFQKITSHHKLHETVSYLISILDKYSTNIKIKTYYIITIMIIIIIYVAPLSTLNVIKTCSKLI